MATTYSMQIAGVQVKWDEGTLQNVITSVTYNSIGISDDGIKKIQQKSIPLPPPSSPDFIPIQDVTEQNITDWILNNPDYLTDQDKAIFEIRFQMEREKEYTLCYNFPFLSGSLEPYIYTN